MLSNANPSKSGGTLVAGIMFLLMEESQMLRAASEFERVAGRDPFLILLASPLIFIVKTTTISFQKSHGSFPSYFHYCYGTPVGIVRATHSATSN